MPNDKNYAKILFDGQTIMDLTDTTATQDTVLMGATFHDATGALKVGTYTSGSGTVTSVAAGTGLTTNQPGGAPILTEGTLSIDTNQVQEKLVSGTNIKTINNQTLLGSGNIVIGGGGGGYEHPTYSTHPSGLYKITVDNIGSVSEAVAVTKADITELGIPAQDTTYENATTATNGLMSADDKQHMGQMLIGGTWYQGQIGGTPQTGYITFVVE